MEINTIITLIVMILIEISLLIFIIVDRIQDSKKYGKENLAVSLEESICGYTFLIIIPTIIAFITFFQKNP